MKLFIDNEKLGYWKINKRLEYSEEFKKKIFVIQVIIRLIVKYFIFVLIVKRICKDDVNRVKYK